MELREVMHCMRDDNWRLFIVEKTAEKKVGRRYEKGTDVE